MTDPIVVDDAMLAELRQQAKRQQARRRAFVPMPLTTMLALIARIEEQGKLLGDSHHQLTMAVLGGFDTEEAHRLLDRIAEADHD